jgi:hypothetical protein
MDYTVFAALAEQTNEGGIWFRSPDLPTRTLVKIYNPATGRSTFCYSRRLDSNFVREYNDRPHTVKIKNPDRAMVISEWYRQALGIRSTSFFSKQDVPLTITPQRLETWGALRAACHHPDIVARIGTRLGILGTWLGLVGIAAPILDLLDMTKCARVVSLIAVAVVAGLIAWIAGRK